MLPGELTSKPAASLGNRPKVLTIGRKVPVPLAEGSVFCNFSSGIGVIPIKDTLMKTFAIIFLSLIAVVLLAPLLSAIVPVVLIGSVLVLPLVLLVAVGSGIVTLAVGVGKIAIGILSIVATLAGFVLFPLILVLLVGGAFLSILF